MFERAATQNPMPTFAEQKDIRAFADAETASAAPSTTDMRVFREIHYEGSTRAVVGPGFVVRELLFGDECVSLRVLAPNTSQNESSLRHASTVGEYRAMLQAASHLVESVRAVEEPAADEGGSTLQGIVAHLKSKYDVAPFQQVIRMFKTTLAGLDALPLRAAPVAPPRRPTVFSRTSVVANVSVTWPVGNATGAAELDFPTARAANAFFHSYLCGRVYLPGSAAVELVGTQVGASASSNSPERPPLKRVSFSESKTVDIYDEVAIEQMTASSIFSHRYVARIGSGLPPAMDESALMALVSGYDCTAAVVERRADREMTQALSDQLMREVKRLLLGSCTVQSSRIDEGDLFSWVDSKRRQTSLRVPIVDLSEVAQVHAQVAQCLDFPRPYGQRCQVAHMYSVRVSIAADAFDFFREQVARVCVDAKCRGVGYSQEPLYACTTRIVYLCRSASLDALRKVVKVLEDVFECESLSHAYLRPAATTGLPAPPRREVSELLLPCRCHWVVTLFGRRRAVDRLEVLDQLARVLAPRDEVHRLTTTLQQQQAVQHLEHLPPRLKDRTNGPYGAGFVTLRTPALMPTADRSSRPPVLRPAITSINVVLPALEVPIRAVIVPGSPRG